MDSDLEIKLTDIAKARLTSEDPSHDIYHTLRVLKNAKEIAEKESGDLDVIIPSALFHDLITYQKNDPRSRNEQAESAQEAAKMLENIPEYPKGKIENVKKSIEMCSFSKGIIPDFLEAKILQDADKLEATGAVSVMRTFSSTGMMKRSFYHPTDPFCENREPENFGYALDLFYSRLLVVKDRMHTDTAKEMAVERTNFLNKFLEQLKSEIS